MKKSIDYATTHPNKIITYLTRYMILVVHRNTSYQYEKKPEADPGGNLFMSSDSLEPPNNGSTLTIAQITKNSHVLSSRR